MSSEGRVDLLLRKSSRLWDQEIQARGFGVILGLRGISGGITLTLPLRLVPVFILPVHSTYMIHMYKKIRLVPVYIYQWRDHTQTGAKVSTCVVCICRLYTVPIYTYLLNIRKHHGKYAIYIYIYIYIYICKYKQTWLNNTLNFISTHFLINFSYQNLSS